MDNSKSSKYVITKSKLSSMSGSQSLLTSLKKTYVNVMVTDAEYPPGCFYTECDWLISPSLMPYRGPEAHKHDFDEIWAFYGSNPEDPENLNGEIEIFLDGEKQTLTKSSLVFIPAGLVHAPMFIRKVDKPILHFVCGYTKSYVVRKDARNWQ
jgi:hypothetical protein